MQSAPLKKKRRLAMPEFESSFDLSSRDSKSTEKKAKFSHSSDIIRNFEGDISLNKTFSPAKRVVTPVTTPRIVRPAFNFPSTAVSPPVEHIRKTRCVSRRPGAFSEHSSTFGVEKKNIQRHTTTPTTSFPDVAAKVRDEGCTTLSTGVFESFCDKTNDAVQTHVRVSVPLRLEATRTPNSRCHSRNVVTPISLKVNKADVENDISLPSRLPLKLDFAPDSPTTKVLGSVSPNVLPSELNRERSITLSKLSHAERADLLVQSTTHKTLQAEICSDLVRGMNISPHKDVSGRRNLVRGGFAERARRLVSKSKTDVALWEAELNKDRSKTLKGDLSLCILSILATTYTPSASPQPTSLFNPRAILARCSSLEGHSNLVLFLFPSKRSNLDFEPGKNVQIWRPWYEVDIPKDNDEAPENRRTLRDMAPSTTMLLCSRFLIVS